MNGRDGVVVGLLVAIWLALLILTHAVTHARPAKPSEPEWLDVGHGIYQTCTDTGRSVLSDGRSLVLDRDDTACEAAG